MRHSEIIETLEGLIKEPLTIASIDRVGQIKVIDANEEVGGQRLKVGDYAVVELRVLLPLDAAQDVLLTSTVLSR